MKKRGQGLSVNVIILIVLGVAVLAVLIIGFTVGWGKIAPWISTNNVDTIANSCAVACNTHSVYDFCTSERELKADGDVLRDVTCNYLAEKQTKYGVSTCDVVTCSDAMISDEAVISAEDINCGDHTGTVYALSTDGKTLLNKDCPAN